MYYVSNIYRRRWHTDELRLMTFRWYSGNSSSSWRIPTSRICWSLPPSPSSLKRIGTIAGSPDIGWSPVVDVMQVSSDSLWRLILDGPVSWTGSDVSLCISATTSVLLSSRNKRLMTDRELPAIHESPCTLTHEFRIATAVDDYCTWPAINLYHKDG